MPESIQTFRDTALRRAKEAHQLLQYPKVPPYHGAVVCSLLSAECALKALILRGYECDNVDEFAIAKPRLNSECFSSARGHQLGVLWNRLTGSIQARLYAQAPNQTLVTETVLALEKERRYDHRYGATYPLKPEAERIVAQANDLAQWVKKALQ